ncbi:uncharacterized protein N7483_011165 [Penicillium malachiteum]|uniref:uncharacterized protein n=1 Tax=Penicillium malachiteum TaxID=1324776 RepID=UPI002546BAC6|nr:uncharacterized protein N7483_011165 [Penicillium malachiteum]KAJ5713984.1 hypothetical protein N7483_011165 [Penicillium malachiteum]
MASVQVASEQCGIPESEDQQSKIDVNIFSVLPNVAHILEVANEEESAWAKAMRIRVQNTNGDE